MLHVLAEAGEPDAEFESGEGELVSGNGRKPRQRDWKRVMME